MENIRNERFTKKNQQVAFCQNYESVKNTKRNQSRTECINSPLNQNNQLLEKMKNLQSSEFLFKKHLNRKQNEYEIENSKNSKKIVNVCLDQNKLKPKKRQKNYQEVCQNEYVNNDPEMLTNSLINTIPNLFPPPNNFNPISNSQFSEIQEISA